MISRETIFRTSDGDVFSTLEAAENHQNKIDAEYSKKYYKEKSRFTAEQLEAVGHFLVVFDDYDDSHLPKVLETSTQLCHGKLDDILKWATKSPAWYENISYIMELDFLEI